MSIATSNSLLSLPAGTQFILDTCVLIDAYKSPDVEAIIGKMDKSGYQLKTLPQVSVEFLRGARDPRERKKLREFLLLHNIKHLSDQQDKLFSQDGALFQIALRRCKVNNPSYVDLLLLFVSSLEDEIYLMTSNFKDMPIEFFDLESIFTSSRDGKEFTNIGIYKFNKSHFDDIISHIEISL